VKKYLPLGAILLLLAGCNNDRKAARTCSSPKTFVTIYAKDYYSGMVPSAPQYFDVTYADRLANGQLSEKESLVTRQSVNQQGYVFFSFTHDPTAKGVYYLRHVADTLYYASGRTSIGLGCDGTINFSLKKRLLLPVTVRNRSGRNLKNLALQTQTLPAFATKPGTDRLSETHQWLPTAPLAELAPNADQMLTVKGLPGERVLLTSRFTRNGQGHVQTDTLKVDSVNDAFEVVIR
jgi:hypothetical protein